MDPITITITFFMGFAAAFIGVIAGGGGLISLAGLTLMGLPPHVAIATNRLGGFGGFFGGIYKYTKSKKIIYKITPPLIIAMIFKPTFKIRIIC